MPCTDVTELIEIKLDNDENLISYRLIKMSCGGSVAGRGLIRKAVKGKSVAEIMGILPDEIIKNNIERQPDEAMDYLQVKHLLTLQAALSVYHGELSDNKSDFISIDSVEHSPDQVVINARIKLNILTEKIKSCGFCK